MKEKILQIIMVVVFVCGLLVFLYPKFTEWKAVYETEKTIEIFTRELTELGLNLEFTTYLNPGKNIYSCVKYMAYAKLC